MSVALNYAVETIAKLLPEDRVKVLHSVVRYCWECGRVGLKNPATLRLECRHCGRDWITGTWVDGYRRIR